MNYYAARLYIKEIGKDETLIPDFYSKEHPVFYLVFGESESEAKKNFEPVRRRKQVDIDKVSGIFSNTLEVEFCPLIVDDSIKILFKSLEQRVSSQ